MKSLRKHEVESLKRLRKRAKLHPKVRSLIEKQIAERLAKLRKGLK